MQLGDRLRYGPFLIVCCRGVLRVGPPYSRLWDVLIGDDSLSYVD